MSISNRQFKVNLPPEVKTWLELQAQQNMRSQTSEIVIALKEKIDRQQQMEKGEAPASTTSFALSTTK